MDICILKNKLESFIRRELELWNFFGVVRVIKNGEIFWEASRGNAVAEFDIKNDCKTRFSLASVSKQFTAFAVMLLADRGLIDIYGDAADYLPKELKFPKGITVYHLLTHTSGLYNFYNFEDDFYVGADRLPYDRRRFFDDWIMHEPRKEAGISFDYNNSNYNLLAWIIENVSKITYEEFLFENIFAPLNMDNTAFDDGFSVINNKADNYMHDYGKLVRVPYVNNLYHLGAGSLVSNCDDLQKWYLCLMNRKLLSAQGYRLFFAENLNHYCCGLNRRMRNEKIEYFHGGDANGISTLTQYCFEDDLCILILSNNESLSQYRLGNAIADIMCGNAPQHSERLPEFPISEAELKKYEGIYLTGKIMIEVKDNRLFLVRPNQNIHIELYCVGPGDFVRKYEEQSSIHHLWPKDAKAPQVWGYTKIG